MIFILAFSMGLGVGGPCPISLIEWPNPYSVMDFVNCVKGPGTQPDIEEHSLETATQGTTYTFQPSLKAGKNVHWTLEYGPDSVKVHPRTGQTTWEIPASLPSEIYYLGLRATNAHGSDVEYWIVKVGSGNVLWVGAQGDFETLGEAFDHMASGDTLIIKDGTYPVSLTANKSYENAIVRGSQPPPGTAGHWTTVIAENPTAVLLDASDNGFGPQEKAIHLVGTFAHPDFTNTNPSGIMPIDYMAIKGIVAGNTGQGGAPPITAWYGEYLKFELCGVFDARRSNTCTDATNWTACNVANFYVLRSRSVLVEQCFAWGHGRYAFQFRNCTESIIRRSVVRLDEYRGHQPRGGIIAYTCRDIEFQNNIVIDSNSSEFWTFYENHANLFGFPATDDQQYPEGLAVRRCLALNCETGFTSQDSGNETILEVANSIGFDLTMNTSPETGRLTPLISSVGNSAFRNCSFGQIKTEGNLVTPRGFAYTRDTLTIDQTIFYRMGWNGHQLQDQGALIWAGPGDSVVATNCDIYDYLHPTYGGNGGGEERVDTPLTVDPRQHGWRYPPRIESGSTLSQAGPQSTRIGASIETFIGASGSFFNEAGFREETNRLCWPFPAQDLIQARMAAYEYTGPTRTRGVQTLSGRRGYCAEGQDLTHYVWGYNGELVPPMPVSASLDQGTVVLQWNPPPSAYLDQVAGYRIYDVTNGRTLIENLPAGTYVFNINGLQTGTHKFVVVAIDSSAQESAAHTTLAVDVP